MQNFSAVMVQSRPELREREVLLAEIDRQDTGRASDSTRAAIAEIELAIQTADADAERGAPEAALRGYQRARGLVYRLLHPRFDVSQWIRDRYVNRLPSGVAVENALLDVSSRLMATLRPEATESTAVTDASTLPIDDALARYTVTGFHRESSAAEILEAAAEQAITLLADRKPEQAIPLIQRAIRAATQQGAQPNELASSQLNLAAALLQSGAPDKARAAAAAAAAAFTASDDEIGLVQALHAQAVSASTAGDLGGAKELFAQIDKVLEAQQVGAPRPAPAGPAGPAGPIGPVRPIGRVDPIGPLLQAARPTLERRLTAATAAQFGARTGRTALADSLDAGRIALVPQALAGLNGRSADVLDPVISHDLHTVAVRVPGRIDGWQTVSTVDRPERDVVAQPWVIGVPVGPAVIDFTVDAVTEPGADRLRDLVYAGRANAVNVADLRLVATEAATTTAYLTHLYAYGLLVLIGDTQHALGQFDQAEQSYVEAAGYRFLNPTTEALALWIRIARNAVEWGSSRYRAGDFDGARAQYTKLIAEDSTVPAASALYTLPGLANPAGTARELIAHLHERPLPPLQWQIAQHVLHALAYLEQLADGLDFYGLALSPIHTFEYLQNVARGFAQESSQAEQEYVNFRSRQQIEAGTRRDLESTLAMARAETEARLEQVRATQADVVSAQEALNLAIRRRNDAQTQRDQYAASSWTQIWSSAAATAQGMGSDSWFNEISELADKLDRGESISGERGKLAAAYTFQAGRRNRTYELAKMQDGINELTAAIPLAQSQLASAQHAATASEISWQASLQRAQLAAAALTAFDANEFTPETWAAMADVMRDISRDYLWRAIRIAKLMERAFNFENDTTLQIIKDAYGHAIANAAGADAVLLGGVGLLADVESFTYIAVTSTRRKQSRIKDVISLATEYPAHFEQFRATGVLSFETDLYEFDRLHPGFHQQRIEAVELQFVGLVPEQGLNGTLVAGGVTRFRKRDGGVGQRVHQIDTMALSDFELRNDLFVYTADTRVRGLFQGLGLGTTWEVRLPRRSNNFDFARIADVQLVVYYTATFDLGLRQAVLTRAPRPGELSAVRDFNLRYDAPDAWYGFYTSGSVDFTLDPVRLPANQRDFTIETVQLRAQPRPGVDPGGLTFSVTAPGRPAVDVVTGADGSLDLTDALPALVGADPLGHWLLSLTGGPSVTENGAVRPDRLVSIQLGLEYTFSYPPEV